MNRTAGVLLLVSIFLLQACADDKAPHVDSPDATTDIVDDVVQDRDADAESPDTVADVETDVGDSPAEREIVAIDLSEFVDFQNPGQGHLRVVKLGDDPLEIQGTGAQGQPGDFLLENQRVRFVVGDERRFMSPCPDGGNLIDAALIDGESAIDVLEEICLLLNVHQTFLPERFEILHDGTNGYGVLAVTGRAGIHDFLNVPVMLHQVMPQFSDLITLIPKEILPISMTVYYILRADDASLQVVTAFRNDGLEQVDLAVSHMVIARGDGGYFNPLNSLGGFGYENVNFASPQADLLPFLGFVTGESSFVYAPKPDPNLQADLPIGGAAITISGVATSLLGRVDVLGTLLASSSSIPRLPGLLHLRHGEVGTVEHRVFAGNGALSTTLDELYPTHGVVTGELAGIVVDQDQAPLAGARVSAVDDKSRTMNQAITDSEGRYRMRVPTGTYELVARKPGRPTVETSTFEVGDGEAVEAAPLVLAAAAVFEVSVRTPDGQPTPARVTVLCEGPCPDKPTPNEEEVVFHGLPEAFAAVEWVGVSGDHRFVVPAGDYRIVVSRGLEWSVWPNDALQSGGFFVTAAAGEVVEINAEIARVLDTSGAMSGDFHVHAMHSADSTVSNQARVLGFMADGLDVVVSTDHDTIADYAPAVEALGAGEEIVSMVGLEVTTSDLGHFNAFPMEHDPTHRRGGALDWGNGQGASLTPQELFAWVRSHPGEQVVQINHAESSFLAFSDVLRRLTYGDPVRMRVRIDDIDPDTGDTGLWSDDFNAMELMNGPGLNRFWALSRWWLTMVGRGQRVTGTAVTDTHRKFSDLGAVPRSYVFVPLDKDTPGSFDAQVFSEAVIAGRVIGTTGPFFRVEATNAQDEVATIGDTLATGGEAVRFDVHIQVPEWMSVTRVEVIINSEDVLRPPGTSDHDPIPPTQSHPVELLAEDLVDVATGAGVHRRYEKQVSFDVATDVDAYVVVLIRGNDAPSMYPVVHRRGTRPFAFANPVYLDADGGGYDNPHLASLAASAPPPAPQLNLGRVGEPSGGEPADHLHRLNELLCDH